MKKLILAIVLVTGLFVNVPKSYGTTLSQTFTANQFTNITNMPIGPFTLKSLIIANTNGIPATEYFYDVPTNQLVITNLGYTNVYSYATNVTNSFTNFYGVTNNYTNVVLIDSTNTVAAITNTNNARITMGVASSTTLAPPIVSQYFINGLWISNSCASNISITLTFSQ